MTSYLTKSRSAQPEREQLSTKGAPSATYPNGGSSSSGSNNNNSSSGNGGGGWWPTRGTPLAQPSGHPEAARRGGERSGSGGSNMSVAVPEAISDNDLAYPAPTQQSTAPTMSGGSQRQQHERKPWLKPVASLLRGIPQPKQQRDWSGGGGIVPVGRFAPASPAVHMVPQQDSQLFSHPGWRGNNAAAVTAAAVVEAGGANNKNNSGGSSSSSSERFARFDRQSRQQQQQQQQQQAMALEKDRSRSVSPRIVRGPLGSAVSPPRSQQQQQQAISSPAGRRHDHLYPLRNPGMHHRSSSLHDHPADARRLSAHGDLSRRFGGGFNDGGGVGVGGARPSYFDRPTSYQHHHRHHHHHGSRHQQGGHFFSTAAADAAVASVPVPREDASTASRMTTAAKGVTTAKGVTAAPDPFRTPTAAAGAAQASTPFWGEPGESPSKQQRNSAVGVVTKNSRQQQQQQCLSRGCSRKPTHATPGEKPSYCAEHRMAGMSDASASGPVTPSGGVSKRNRCLMPGCSKPPRYALPGHKAEYCTLHKMDNYVDVKHPRCESELGCVRQPTFGWEGEKARFCSAHKIENMLDVKNPRCGEPGCLKRPRYGEEGGRARFCAAHRFDDMVDLASRRSSGGGNSGSKLCSSPAKRPRNGPRVFAHDSAAAAATAAAASPSNPLPSFSLRAAVGGGGGGGGGRRGGGGGGGGGDRVGVGAAPAPKRGHTPAHAGGHRRATSESWIDFCPKRVFETTSAKDAADVGGTDAPVPRHPAALRRAKHHHAAPRSVNANMAAMAAAAAASMSAAAAASTSSISLSAMGSGSGSGSGSNFHPGDCGNRDERHGSTRGHRRGVRGFSSGVASAPFFHGGSGGSSGSSVHGWGSGGGGTGWMAGSGDVKAAAAAAAAAGGGGSGDMSSVSIAALGGEIATITAAPISDASPLPSPGSVSSSLSTGGAPAPASASGPAPSPACTPSGSVSGFGFSSPSPSNGGSGTAGPRQLKKKAPFAAPVATVTAPVTPQSSSDSIDGAAGGGRRGEGGGGGGGGHRFNASDYEASAILLECRSGMLSGEQRI